MPTSLSADIAWRYLRGRRGRPEHRSRLLGGTARAALLATALGVTAMVIAMALMTGYREELQRKLIGGNAAVVAYPLAAEGAVTPAPEKLRALRGLPGVTSVGAVVYGQGTLSSAALPQGVEITLRGVEDGGEMLGGGRAALAAGPDGISPVVLGAELRQRLGVAPGDLLRMVALGVRGGVPRFRFQTLRVGGEFRTGFSEFDRSWAVVERGRLAEWIGSGGAELYEIRLTDPALAPATGRQAGELLGSSYLVTDWQEMNRELFTALRVQQLALFLVLGLIVLVSTFNVASTLVVLVRERIRDVGVLAAMGLGPAGVRTVFVLYGGLLGLAGTLLGVLVGGGAAWALDRFQLIRFDPDVAAIYFINSVPFRVAPGDVAAVVGFALAVNLAACLVPAWRAARTDPSSALRYE